MDGSGNAYVTGDTAPTESHLPGHGRAGPDLQRRLATTPSWPRSTPTDRLVYCGYIGGIGDDVGYGIAVDGAGNAYVTGYTGPPRPPFPVTVGPDLTHNGGVRTPSWPRSTPRAPALVYCGYIGGSDDDAGYGIAVDGSGNAYVTGDTVPPRPPSR